MKKLVIISFLLSSILALSGPKNDLKKSDELESAGKTLEAKKVLMESKPVKGEEKEYEIVNYLLAMNYSETMEEKIKYLKKIADNIEKSDTDIAIGATEELIDSLEDDDEKIKYLEILNEKIGYSEVLPLAMLAGYCKIKNNISYFDEILDYVEKKEDQEFYEEFYLELGKYLLNLNAEDEGIQYINESTNSEISNVRAKAYLILSQYYGERRNLKKVCECLEKASENPENYLTIAQNYSKYTDDIKKAYSYVLKANEISPTEDSLRFTFILSTIVGDTETEKKLGDILIKKIKNIGITRMLKNVNDDYRFAGYHDLNLEPQILKYGEKALADGEKGAYLCIAMTYFNMKKYDLAKIYAEKAIENGIDQPEVMFVLTLSELKLKGEIK